MTFFEAALHILEKEGKPLHFKYITEKAVAEKLLSHVGKDPEATMYYRLAAMAKRKGDRKVVATQPGTFGLLDWGVLEDPAALEVAVLPVPDETEPPLRPRERHPIPRGDNVRVAGRGERKHRHEEREKKRKLQSLPELAFEVLTKAPGPMPAVDVASALRDTDKVAEDFGSEALLHALREDNRRRQSHDRKPLFLISDTGEITLEKAGAPGEGVPVELQAAFAQSLGIPLEGGVAEARKPERLGPGAQRVLQQVREHQKNMGRVLRRRFGDLELGAAELVAQAMLEAHGFSEVRPTKRGKEGLVLTARRREGLLDVRYAARVFKGNREVTKTDVADLRRDLVNHNAHVGLVIGAGEVSRDARTEALAGGALMLLWCGEALTDKLLEKRVGSTATTVEIVDVDEAFFRRAKDQGTLDDKRRDERRKERDAREDREKTEKVARDAEQGAPQPPATPTEGAAPAQAEATASAATPEAAPAAEANPPANQSLPPTNTAQVQEVEGVITVRVDLSQPKAESPEQIAESLARTEPAPAQEAKPTEGEPEKKD